MTEVKLPRIQHSSYSLEVRFMFKKYEIQNIQIKALLMRSLSRYLLYFT